MIPTELALKGKAAVGAKQKGGMWARMLGFHYLAFSFCRVEVSKDTDENRKPEVYVTCQVTKTD